MNRLATIVLVALCLVSGCGYLSGSNDPGRTTDTASSAFDTTADRVDFLTDYITERSPILETQFHIVYRDNSTGMIPGPSDWTIRYAVRVDPGDLDLWTEGMAVIDPVENWDESMLAGWPITTDSPVFYQRPGLTLAVYEADGVVVGYDSTVPLSESGGEL